MATDASLKTRESSILSEPTDNIFESLVIIGKRARQISSIQKEELNGKRKRIHPPPGYPMEKQEVIGLGKVNLEILPWESYI